MSRQVGWSVVAGGLTAVVGVAGLTVLTGGPSAQQQVAGAVPTSSEEPPATDATSTTAAAPASNPAIAASGYFVRGGFCDAPRITSAHVGETVTECWVIENTGNVTFDFHLVSSNLWPVGNPAFDGNAPDELTTEFAPGESIVHPGSPAANLDQAGTWRAQLNWEAFARQPDEPSLEATASVQIDLAVSGSTSTPTTTRGTLPATG